MPKYRAPRGIAQRGIYLAGPSGFTEAGLVWHNEVVVPKITAACLLPVDPWGGSSVLAEIVATMEWGPDRRQALQVANRDLGRLNLAMIDASAGVLACLDGQDVDSGTAAEIGYAHARGKLVVGLRTDTRLCADNEGGWVNLMVETCVVDSGGIMTSSLDHGIAHLVARLLV